MVLFWDQPYQTPFTVYNPFTATQSIQSPMQMMFSVPYTTALSHSTRYFYWNQNDVPGRVNLDGITVVVRESPTAVEIPTIAPSSRSVLRRTQYAL
ncbi:hypothetical protein DPMN_042363 [Dreissena polymorpha]|uniref:Uncharacterized protein n=1 Tax=Dreissena polymorpha TaxID=45954 RepID=A0A9D4HUP6_DREPO|nr:hypothetical protein DPMN_042363 [Dreissena polymorpha]